MAALLFSAGFGNAKPPVVESVPSSVGQIVTVHAAFDGDQMYLTGLAKRPSAPSSSLCVEIRGVDSNHRTVFSKSVPIRFTGNPSLSRTATYVVKIDSSVLEKAIRVYVTFSNGFPVAVILAK